VSRLVPKKGIDVLLDALALMKSRDQRSRAEIIGGGPLLEELQRRAAELDIEDRVDFLGRQPSSAVSDAYRRCSMVVLPCRIDDDGDRDGMPTVLIEALARGIGVISTDIVGIPELVRHEITGLLVPPDDPLALADAMGRLLDDPALASRLGSAGRDLVAIDHDPGRSVEALRAVFARRPEALAS
jgi:glycosyltransferase involved in cell wall biosynthesis